MSREDRHGKLNSKINGKIEELCAKKKTLPSHFAHQFFFPWSSLEFDFAFKTRRLIQYKCTTTSCTRHRMNEVRDAVSSLFSYTSCISFFANDHTSYSLQSYSVLSEECRTWHDDVKDEVRDWTHSSIIFVFPATDLFFLRKKNKVRSPSSATT